MRLFDFSNDRVVIVLFLGSPDLWSLHIIGSMNLIAISDSFSLNYTLEYLTQLSRASNKVALFDVCAESY